MNLTNENYYSQEANREYASCSQWKAFKKCPACAMAELRGEWSAPKTPALLIGGYVDAWFEGSLEQFKAANPELFTQKGVLKKEYLKAEYIIERVQRDKMFMEYMSGEKQAILTGTVNGVKCKIKIDSLDVPNKRFTDLKVMRDFEPIYDADELGRVPFWIAWDYTAQLGLYKEIIRQNYNADFEGFIAAVTKQDEPDLGVFHMSGAEMQNGLERVAADLPRIDAIKSGILVPENCGECNYCRYTKVLTEVIETESYLL